MSEELEFSGKTLELAIQAAADALDADPESIDYRMVESPKRFFFRPGPREFRIRVLSYDPQQPGSTRVSLGSAGSRVEEDWGEQPPDSPAEAAPWARSEIGEAEEEEAGEEALPGEVEEEEEGEEAEGAPAAERAEIRRVQEVVGRFIRLWKLDLQAKVKGSGDRVEVYLSGHDQDYLLERKGAALLSLQLILGKMLFKNGLLGRKLQVDCGGYRQRREKELQQIAERYADKVKQLGEDCYLSPLNPYERRIVHLALLEDEQVTTVSEGEGYLKKIRITLREPEAQE
jgi:spoIIIJ-associated protein